ncbi:hypothetical protein CLV62_15013 [Dysgonomonas alginatilytica]|uniref:Major fimbrial subunit protein N-terminal domain-containing protein n=1 Tax=Dysgonomonas alginatilytica TaxID=1605892 RepID=A0A2V3PHE3_9BACT|nr:fimbrial protein [Dysgonomonas alginatilytica]PXV58388.1 hypothetical protein CLV62_15013 [Dysgonomonas alginatilytica]
MKPVCQYKSIAISRVSFLLLAFAILATISIFTSCSKEEEDLGKVGSRNIKVQFHTTNLLLVRQTPGEAQISQVQALVFIDNGEGYTYNYTASGTSLINSDNLSATFDIEIYTETRPVKIYIIANSNDAISSNQPMVGETENEVKQKLTKAVTSTNITGNFPMWGEYSLPSGISGTLNNTVAQLKVLRAIARVDINSVDSPANFIMTSVQAFRVSSQLQIAPNAYSGSLLVSGPSIPTGSSSTINTTPIPVIGNTSEAQLYLPESEAPAFVNQVSEATCVIIGGRYNGSTTVTYYRLDFAPDIPEYPLGQILRNHHYTFDILKVTSAGWPTPEEAAENISANIEVASQDWSDANINVGIDDTDYFRLSKRNIELAATAGSTGYTFVSTSIPSYTIQWSDASGNPLGDPAGSIDDGVIRVTKSNYAIFVEAITDNPSAEDNLKYILIVAKRARIVISINQLGL